MGLPPNPSSCLRAEGIECKAPTRLPSKGEDKCEGCPGGQGLTVLVPGLLQSDVQAGELPGLRQKRAPQTRPLPVRGPHPPSTLGLSVLRPRPKSANTCSRLCPFEELKSQGPPRPPRQA